MKKTTIYEKMRLGVFLLLSCMLWAGASAQTWQLYWEDQFDGTTINTDYWELLTGNGTDYGVVAGWGNGERQYYTDRPENAYVDGGYLHIITKAENYGGYEFTSARLRTLNKIDFKYGKVEALIRLPWSDAGLLPAFWMLPSRELYGNWPKSGEIDIAECFGYHQNTIHGTHHFGRSFTDKGAGGGSSTLSPDWMLYNWDFYKFGMEWDETTIKFFVNDVQYGGTVSKAYVENLGYTWSADQTFHLLLNVAVDDNSESGEYQTGWADPNNFDDREMFVDWVRVYQKTGHLQITGKQKVLNTETAVTYSMPFNSQNSGYHWTVPAGAAIVSGQGTHAIAVNFSGASGGNISVNYSNSVTGATTVSKAVTVTPIACSLIINDFEGNQQTTITGWTTGSYSTTSNPAPNSVNGSATCLRYQRSNTQQYDKLNMQTEMLPDVSEFRAGTRTFKLDVYTSGAPIGTAIDIALENMQKAKKGNANGQHSIYRAITTKQSQWETLEFTLQSTPDVTVEAHEVDQVQILPAPNTNAGYTFYFDNFKSQCNDNVSPDFTADKVSPELNEVVTFTDATIGTANTYAWNFGTGASPTTAATAGPHQVQYTTSGHKSVSLTVNGVESEVKTNLIWVHPALNACDLAYDDFDDETTSWINGTGFNPGKYAVTESGTSLTITGGNPQEWDYIDYELNDGSNGILIDWSDTNRPVLKFRARTLNDTATVRFQAVDETGLVGQNEWVNDNRIDITPQWQLYSIDMAALNLLYDQWGANNGGSNWETLGNLKKIRIIPSQGHVSFPYTNSFGKPVTVFKGTLLIDWIKLGDVCDLLEDARFEASDVSPNVSESITFTDVSTGSVSSWSWDFGVGASPATANSAGPHVVAYTSSGYKTVALTINGGITKTITGYIDVHESGQPCGLYADDFHDGPVQFADSNPFTFSKSSSNLVVSSAGHDEWEYFSIDINDGLDTLSVDFGDTTNIPVLTFRARATDTCRVLVDLVDGNGLGTRCDLLNNNKDLSTNYQVFSIDFSKLLFNVNDDGSVWTPIDSSHIRQVRVMVNPGYASYPFENDFGQTISTAFKGNIEIDWIKLGTSCETPVGILGSHPDESKARAYPNPFEHTITIDQSILSAGINMLRIYDMTGQLVLDLLVDGQTQVQIGDQLSQGLYLLQVRNERTVYQTTILKR